MFQIPILPEVSRFLADRQQLLINGRWQPAASGETLPIKDPSSDEVITEVSSAGSEDVDRAVAAARAAFTNPAWRRMTPAARARLLIRIAELLEQRGEQFAQIDALDTGLPLALGRGMSGAVAAAMFRYNAGWCERIGGRTVTPSSLPDERGAEAVGPAYHAYTLRQPVGVVGIIIPWNFPLIMAAAKLAPALAAGCTIVLKPAENAPLNPLLLGQVLLEAGVPDGVVNILPGLGHSAGAALAAHPGINKIHFTGSTRVGRTVIAAAQHDMKRVALELGGKAPILVAGDADLARAIPSLAQGIFINTGQICFAGARVYAERAICDELVDGVAQIARKMQVGAGLDPGSQMGPLISAQQRDRVVSYLDSAGAEGVSIVTGGKRIDRPGYFVEPTVAVTENAAARVVREEIFGPVITVTPVDDVRLALAAANDTTYGLSAGVFTRDLARAHQLAAELEAGSVWVNRYPIVDVAMPFGGFKQSGWGRENGEEGVLAYTEHKSVVMEL